MVPGPIFVGEYFPDCGRLSLGLGRPPRAVGGSCAGCVSIEWAIVGVLESLALGGSDGVLVGLRDRL
eukprot:scaffold6456_cov98-Isochrysis_galbana.AAC.12